MSLEEKLLSLNKIFNNIQECNQNRFNVTSKPLQTQAKLNKSQEAEQEQRKKIHTNKNVCLLKEEKLLIEKLALIIGGFYQPRSSAKKFRV